MDSAIAGLIGALIGALAGVAGAFISQHMQARAARQRALQSKKEEAYSSTLRSLLRVQNKRSGIVGESGRPFLRKESIQEWFNDLVDAQFWASTLIVYCSADQKETIIEVSHKLNDRVAALVRGTGLSEVAPTEQDAHSLKVRDLNKEPLSEEFEGWYETILACARKDIGESYAR